jgi:hypothetical protein
VIVPTYGLLGEVTEEGSNIVPCSGKSWHVLVIADRNTFFARYGYKLRTYTGFPVVPGAAALVDVVVGDKEPLVC